MSIGRGPQRCSRARSRPSARSTSWARASSTRGDSDVSTAIAQLMKGGCSGTPRSRVRESARRSGRAGEREAASGAVGVVLGAGVVANAGRGAGERGSVVTAAFGAVSRVRGRDGVVAAVIARAGSGFAQFGGARAG